MKITEILTESQQQEFLNEGPIGDVAKKVARGAGKAIGGVGKVAGAIAGIPGGIKRAFQSGKQAAQDVIGGTGQGADAPEPVGTAAGAAPQTTAAINKQGPSGTAPAAVSGGAQQQAVAKTAQATAGNVEKANQTVYAQVKSQINNLDKKGKQRILQLLQKSLQQTPAKPAAVIPAAAPANALSQKLKPAAGPGSATAPAGPGAAQRTEPDLNAPAEQPVAAAGKKKPAPKKKVAPSQAEIDADRQRVMGVTSDSVVRTGRVVAESFTFYRR